MFTLLDDNEVGFNIWTPVSKAVGANDDNRILRGVASTERKDLQNEIVIQKGLDVSSLLRGGFINWNHAARGSARGVIGKPINAGVGEDGLFVEAKIFKGIPDADAAWDLACYLNENPDDGKLGWSIEGHGVRKGNVVVNTQVRHVALTHDPVQRDTWASVVKAMTEGFDVEELIDISKTLSTENGSALLLENLDSNQKGNLLRELFFGKVAGESADKIWNSHGIYRNGALGAHRQLVSKGVDPEDAKNLLIQLRDARLFG